MFGARGVTPTHWDRLGAETGGNWWWWEREKLRRGSHNGALLKLVVGITGASGIQYGISLLEQLQGTLVEVHLVVSASAQHVMQVETSELQRWSSTGE